MRRAAVLVAGDTLEGHLRNAQTIMHLKRQLDERLTDAELEAIARRLDNALGCLELERVLS